jgi:hypothetical protein
LAAGKINLIDMTRFSFIFVELILKRIKAKKRKRGCAAIVACAHYGAFECHREKTRRHACAAAADGARAELVLPEHANLGRQHGIRWMAR